MKLLLTVFMGLFFLGCSPITKGDYVTYTSDDYLFMQDNFSNQSINCLELGELKQGGLNVKYCIGENYASNIVQGFIFQHQYTNINERFIGAKLSFKTKDVFTIECNSETIENESSGTEYINCMIPQRHFDIFAFIMRSKKDLHGQFSAAVGSSKIYNGVIDKEGKEQLKKFYKDIAKKEKIKWKKGSL